MSLLFLLNITVKFKLYSIDALLKALCNRCSDDYVQRLFIVIIVLLVYGYVMLGCFVLFDYIMSLF